VITEHPVAFQQTPKLFPSTAVQVPDGKDDPAILAIFVTL